MKIAILISSSILVALAGSVAAQPAQTPPASELEPAPARAEPKSEGLALGLSIGGTTASWGLVVVAHYADKASDDAYAFPWAALAFFAGGAGALLAPSAGHWYGGKLFTRGMAVRAAGVATLVGAFAWWVEIEGGLDGDAPTAEEETVIPEVLAVAGLALMAAGTVDDIVTAPRRVRRWNRAHGLAIAPIVTPGAAGLALGGRF